MNDTVTLKTQPITGETLLNTLTEKGIVDEKVRRVIIDIPFDGAVLIYAEFFGDTRLIEGSEILDALINSEPLVK